MGTYERSNSNHIDSLLESGKKWGSGNTGTGAVVTYRFSNRDDDIYTPHTLQQRERIRAAFNAWSNLANVTFLDVTDFPNMSSQVVILGGGAQARVEPSENGLLSAEVDIANVDDLSAGAHSYGLNAIHEIGHALGLKHPHDPGYFNAVANLFIDTTLFSVMSYRAYVGQPITGAVDQSFYPTTPMLNDIAAIQHIYGSNMNTNSGTDIYNWDRLSEGRSQILMAIWDAGGIYDTIDWSDQDSRTVINLNPGQWSELGPAYWNGISWERRTLAIAYGVQIENAIGGTGNDEIYGNSTANNLYGKAGDDRLSGGAGNDWLSGEVGNDQLYGDDGDDALVGMEGDDYIDGGLDSDRMFGGVGDDIYIIDNEGDIVTENLDEGIDAVTTTVSYALGANVENLSLRGDVATAGFGNEFNNYIFGSSYDNYLGGNDGNDSLDGSDGNDLLSGGFGNDSLWGGSGLDQMYGDSGDDFLLGATGSDSLDGSEGNDILYGDYKDIIAYKGHLYLLSTPGNWGKAQAEAQSLGGNLVAINDASEQEWLANTFGTNELLWIGLTDQVEEGLWQWVNDEPVTYQNWATGEPNNNIEPGISSQGEDYAAMSLGDSTWTDLNNEWRELQGIIELPYSIQEFINRTAGNDTLIGGSGNDILRGGAGDDILSGGTGTLNYLFGDAGADTFVLSKQGFSRVFDFAIGQDFIELSDGLKFNQLRIEQGIGVNSDNTWIKFASNGENLLLLSNVRATDLTPSVLLAVSYNQASRLTT